MKELSVDFKSKGKRIAGILHLPKRENAPVVIFLHGWGMGKGGNPQFTFVRAARELCDAGFAVLRFDFRGVGDSEGDFEDYTQTTMLEDLNAAISYLKNIKEVNSEKIGVLGWSMGGSTAIIGAARNKKIRCVVSWASPANHKDLWSPSLIEELEKKGRMILDYSSGLSVTWKGVLEDFKHKTYEEIRKVNVPVLIINGTEDTLVYPTQAEKLYKNANRPKKLVLIKGAHHGFYGENEKKELLKESLYWFKKWLK